MNFQKWELFSGSPGIAQNVVFNAFIHMLSVLSLSRSFTKETKEKFVMSLIMASWTAPLFSSLLASTEEKLYFSAERLEGSCSNK